jgi:hypothetical protein
MIEKLLKYNKTLKIILAIFIAVIAIFITNIYQQKSTNQSVDVELSQYSDKKNTEEQSLFDVINSTKVQSFLALVTKPNKKCTVSLSIVSNDNTAPVGGQIVYNIKVKNIGKVQCKNTSLSLYYADNESFVSSDIKTTASNYYWNLGVINSGIEKNIMVTTQATGYIGDSVALEGCATADSAIDSCASNGVKIIGSIDITPTPVISTLSEYGVWVWTSPLQMSQQYMVSIVDAAKTNGINTLYVTIDDFLDIHSLPEGASKTIQKSAYSDALESLIRIANQQGIEVDAEAGWRDWAEPAQKYKAFAIVDYVKEYNMNHSEYKLRGFQYDVEPYLLSTYEKNKGPILTKFVQLIDETVTRLGNSDLRFAVVIPHFYDDAQAWTPAVTYNGKTQHTFNHLLNLLDQRKGSSIILMSYRNFAEGNNGSIQISDVEVRQALGSTKVIVGQETGNVDPAYVTFYGLSKAQYLSQIEIIKNAFKDKIGFGGMAVHYIEPFLELK